MHVSCPNCNTKYNLPDSMIKPGAKAKCTKCEHLFPLGPELIPAPAPAMPDESESGFDVDIDSDLEDDILGDLDAGGDDLDIPSDLVGEEEGPGLDFGDDDDGLDVGGAGRDDDGDGISFGSDELDEGLGFDLDDGSKKKDKKKAKGGSKKGLLIVLILLLALGGGFAGVWFLAPDLLPFGQQGEDMDGEDGEVKTDVISTKKIKDIVLLNVKQYVITNDKVGQLVVIEGKVVNNFPVPKELIKVQASMFDDTGVVVDSRQLLCGNIVSLYQLQTLSEPELDEALNNKVGILTNNTNIQPGSDVPFMIVFSNPPTTASSFGVDVIEAKDPPKE